MAVPVVGQAVLECPPIDAPAGVFRAGFGRADITTPPGPGLAGYGPEGKASTGWRQRIHARAMALEDARGERIVIAAVDLVYVSGALHRAVARRVERCGGPPADRLILAATHTHAAPGHFSMHRAYDEQASSVAGYDPAILAFLAGQTARAVLHALAGLRPAVAAWGSTDVWGITRIRSYPVHVDDEHSLPHERGVEPPPDLPPPFAHVDPTLRMLRIDTLGPQGAGAAGAFSTFAIHGTGNPASNELIDADVLGSLQRRLERWIDRRNGTTRPTFATKAVHVVANGAEGDVVPALPGNTYRDSVRFCDPPVLRRPLRPGGPRSPPAFETWQAGPDASDEACIAWSRPETDSIGGILSDSAVALYERLGGSLSADLQIGRAFSAVALRTDPATAAERGLCEHGRPGMVIAAGAETGRTRLLRRKLLFFSLGIEPGGSAVRPGSDCQSPKRTAPRRVEELVVGDHPVEEMMQLMVVRVGTMLLAAVPFETTTLAGLGILGALRDVIGETPGAPGDAALIGLSNGYLQYLTTDREYARQHYEGGANLYGPGTARFVMGQLDSLTRSLARNAWSSPETVISDFPTYPGKERRILPARGRVPDGFVRAVRSLTCSDGVLVLRWLDVAPGSLFPADGQVVGVEELRDGTWVEVGWDDHEDLEVRVVARVDRTRFLWEARWARDSEHSLRFVLTPRGNLPGVRTSAIASCARP